MLFFCLNFSTMTQSTKGFADVLSSVKKYTRYPVCDQFKNISTVHRQKHINNFLNMIIKLIFLNLRSELSCSLRKLFVAEEPDQTLSGVLAVCLRFVDNIQNVDCDQIYSEGADGVHAAGCFLRPSREPHQPHLCHIHLFP